MIKQLNYRAPGSETLKLLQDKRGKSYTGRSFNMFVLQKTEKGMCAWCNEFPVTKKNAKYCDRDCGDSAMVYCYPQDKHSKGFMLLKQNFKCSICSEDFSEYIRDQIRRNEERTSYRMPLNIWGIGTWIAHLMDADHKVAIVNGGAGLGVDNIHLICKPCHVKKTSQDMKERREKIKTQIELNIV
jgi:hypothetical protein